MTSVKKGETPTTLASGGGGPVLPDRAHYRIGGQQRDVRDQQVGQEAQAAGVGTSPGRQPEAEPEGDAHRAERRQGGSVNLRLRLGAPPEHEVDGYLDQDENSQCD